jgi:hypothetical protein
MCSIYITVGLAVERCHAVVTPSKYRSSELLRKNSIARLLKYTIPILLASVIFNLPSFFETRNVNNNNNDLNTNNNVNNNNNDDGKMSGHGSHSTIFYNFYYHLWYKAVARLLVVAVVPFSVFCVMNFRIYFAIKKIRENTVSSTGCLELEQVLILKTLKFCFYYL